MSAAVGARNLFKVDAGVVHALLQARYYDGGKGEFLSEDPVFWGKQNIPDPQAPTSWRTAGNVSNSAYANTQQKGNPTSGWSDAYMRDPQAQNSYSYSRDNPMRYSDPDGLLYKEFATGQQSWPSFQLELGRAAGQLSQDSATWNYAIGHPIEGGMVVGAMSGGAAVSGAGGIALGSAFNPTLAIAGLINAYGWGQTGQSYLQYRATGNTTARNNAGFDMGVNTASFIGSTRQNAQQNRQGDYSAKSGQNPKQTPGQQTQSPNQGGQQSGGQQRDTQR